MRALLAGFLLDGFLLAASLRAQVASPPTLGQRLESADERECAEAVGLLVAQGKAAVPVLLAAWRNGSWNARAHAAWSLGLLGGDAATAVPQLLADLARFREHPDQDLKSPLPVEGPPLRLRAFALWALRRIDGGASLPLLQEALADSNQRLRVEAAWALAELARRGGPGIDPLLRHMASVSKRAELDQLAHAVAAAGTGAIPGLIAIVRDDPEWHASHGSRVTAERALGLIGNADPRVTTALTEMLATSHWTCRTLRLEALRALEQLRFCDAAVLRCLSAMLDGDLKVGAEAVGDYLARLAAAPKRGAAAVLAADLGVADPVRRVAAVRLLGLLLADQPPVPADPDEMVVVAEPAWHEAVAQPVLPALADVDTRVQLAAVEALAPFALRPEVAAALAARREKAHPELIAAIDRVQKQARATEPRPLAALEPLRARLRSATGAALDEALFELRRHGVGAAPAAGDLLALADTTSGGTRAAAALDVLESIGPAAAVATPVLLERLATTNAELIARTLGALAAILPAGTRAGDAVPALSAVLAATQEHEVAQQEAAANCLARFGPKASAAVPALIRVLRAELPLARSKEEEVLCLLANARTAAADALAHIGPDAATAVPALMQILAHEGPRLSLLPVPGAPSDDWIRKPHMNHAVMGSDPDGHGGGVISSANVAAAACRALATMGPAATPALPLLAQRAQDGVAFGTREAARAALSALKRR